MSEARAASTGVNCSRCLMCAELCRPAIVFLREVDSDVPCMGKVYYRCFQLQQKMDAVEWLEMSKQKWLSEALGPSAGSSCILTCMLVVSSCAHAFSVCSKV